MKKLLLVATLFAVLLFPLTATAKDKKDRNEDYYKKEYKETRDDVKELRGHYERVRDQLRNGQGVGSSWEQLRAIGVEVDRVSVQFERGTDPRYLRDRIRQLESSLTRLSRQAQESGRRGGYYDSRRRY